MPSVVPASKLWTLRLKREKKTVLLFADPSQSLYSLKQNLLEALRITNPTNTLGAVPIPTSPDDVEIAKPIDQLDISQGWTAIDPPVLDDELASDDDGTKKSSRSRAKSQNVSLKSLGIKENHVLAFRFIGEVDEEDETMGDDVWKVEIAAYDDMYAAENDEGIEE